MSDNPAAAEYLQLVPEDDKSDFSWVSTLGFAYLTYNTAAAAYRSFHAHDSWALAFVLTAYFDLVSLFYCLRQFERADDRNKSKLKVAIWLLATLLTAMFSHQVASIMPWPVAALVWGMASATILGGFYAFFLYREPSTDQKAKSLNKIIYN